MFSTFKNTSRFLASDLPRRYVVALQCLVVLLTLVPVLSLVSTLNTHALSIPYLDQWDISLDIAKAVADDSLTLDHLIGQHSDHRHVFSFITTALVTKYANWDMRVERGVSLVLVGMTVFLWLSVLYRQDKVSFWWMLLPIFALLFAIRGRYTFLISFQTCFVFPLFWATTVLVALYHLAIGWRALALMIVLAVFTTFSITSGMIIWVACLPAMFLKGYRRPAHYLLWLLVAAISIFLYFQGFDSGRTQVGASTALERPLSVVAYILMYLGSPFVVDTSESVMAALIVGTIGVVLLVCNIALVVASRRTADIAVWIGLAAFALGVASTIAVGRIHYTMTVQASQPLHDRYVIHSVLFWMALLAIAASNLRHAKFRGRLRLYGRTLLPANLVIFVVLSALFVSTAVNTYFSPPSMIPSWIVHCYEQLLVGDTSNDCIYHLYPHEPPNPHLLERVREYRDYGFGVHDDTSRWQ